MKYLITIKGNDGFYWEGEFSSFDFTGAVEYARRTIWDLRKTTIESLYIDCIKRISEGEQEP